MSNRIEGGSDRDHHGMGRPPVALAAEGVGRESGHGSEYLEVSESPGTFGAALAISSPRVKPSSHLLPMRTQRQAAEPKHKPARIDGV